MYYLRIGFGKVVPELGLDQFPSIQPYTKSLFSMLTPEILDRMAKEFPEVKSVIICGFMAHVCVQSTTLDLLNRGFEVHVVADAVSSPTQDDRVIAFNRMRDAGAYVTTTQSALISLAADTKSPFFLQFQEVIMLVGCLLFHALKPA